MSTELSRRHLLGLGCGLAAGGWLGRASWAEDRLAAGEAPDVRRAPLTTFLPVPSSPLVAIRFAFLSRSTRTR